MTLLTFVVIDPGEEEPDKTRGMMSIVLRMAQKEKADTDVAMVSAQAKNTNSTLHKQRPG